MSPHHCSATDCAQFVSHRLPFCTRHQPHLTRLQVEKLLSPNRETPEYRKALEAAIATVAERERMAVAG